MFRQVVRKLGFLAAIFTIAFAAYSINYSESTGLILVNEAHGQTCPWEDPAFQACVENCWLGWSAGAPWELVQQCLDSCHQQYCY